MTTQVDARELLDLLESANIQVVEQVKELILENLSTSKYSLSNRVAES